MFGNKKDFENRGFSGILTNNDDVVDVYYLGKLQIYVEKQISNFYRKFLERILKHVSGMPPILENSLYTDHTNENDIIGLTDIIVSALISNARISIIPIVIEDRIVFRSVFFENKEVGGIKIFIDGQRQPTNLLKIFFSMDYFITRHLAVSLNLANKPFLKLSGFRTKTTVFEEDDLRKTVKDALHAMRGHKGFLTGDSEDLLELLKIDSTAPLEIELFIYKKIANIMNLPLSFVTGALGGDLKYTAGDWDTEQLENSLETQFKSFLNPLFQTICNVLNLDGKNIVFKNQFTENSQRKILQELTALLPNLENSTLLNEEEKKAILKNFL